MIYARINLKQTDYAVMQSNWGFIDSPNIDQLNRIYHEYCRYKQFTSVMPIFDSEYINNDVIGYYDKSQLVAFSIIKKYDTVNVEAVQFAWTYHQPKLALGIASLKHECAVYKMLGYKFLYLGEADDYKTQLTGFELLGPV